MEIHAFMTKEACGETDGNSSAWAQLFGEFDNVEANNNNNKKKTISCALK